MSTKSPFVLVLLIHKGYCVVKKLVWNVHIKAFWYTNLISFLVQSVWKSIWKTVWHQRQDLITSYCFIIMKALTSPSSLTGKQYSCDNIYFRLRFGLVQTIDTYLRLKIRVVGENQKSFQTGFLVQITMCSNVVNSQSIFVVKILYQMLSCL